MKKITLIITLFVATIVQGCGIYSFTGGDTGDAETIQVSYFPNNALLIEPSLSQTFTTQFQDLFLRQTNLKQVNSAGDLQFEGEITGYKINPMTATAEQTAAQNRLTITVNVRFFNNTKEEDNFERSFSHYYDYGANVQLVGGLLEDAFSEIIERITQDVFNASLAKW